ncbi:MAG TPA: molybdenum transporter [bacterium]|nr:molybdenum transporter [bacterium]
MSRFASTQKGRRSRADIVKDLGKGKKLKLRFWVEKDGETFLAQGRINLLETIEKTNSLSKAAKQLKISYRHAWLLLSGMNRISSKPLIQTLTGGSSGGGTFLTAYARRIIKEFYRIKSKLEKIGL